MNMNFNRLTATLINSRSHFTEALTSSKYALSTLSTDITRVGDTLSWRAEGWMTSSEELALIEGLCFDHEHFCLELIGASEEEGNAANDRLSDEEWNAAAEKIVANFWARSMSDLLREEPSNDMLRTLEEKAKRNAKRKLMDLLGFSSWRFCTMRSMMGLMAAQRAVEEETARVNDSMPKTLRLWKDGRGLGGVYRWSVLDRNSNLIAEGNTACSKRADARDVAMVEGSRVVREWNAANGRDQSIHLTVEVVA